VSLHRTFATSLRILRQLRHDHRTLGLVLFMPSILLIVLHYVFFDRVALFSTVAPQLLGVLPFVLMFIVSSVAVLRERSSGTLERLLVSPASRLDIIVGYGLAFAVLALVQTALASFITVTFLGVVIVGGFASLLLCTTLAGLLGMAFGLLFSGFARNEFQAVQFMPAFVLPQFLTCGLLVPRETMHQALQYFADIMPITYVVDAMQRVQQFATIDNDLRRDILVLVGFTLLAIVLGALSLRTSEK